MQDLLKFKMQRPTGYARCKIILHARYSAGYCPNFAFCILKAALPRLKALSCVRLNGVALKTRFSILKRCKSTKKFAYNKKKCYLCAKFVCLRADKAYY